MFGLHWAQKTKPCFVTLRIFFSFLFPPSSFLLPPSSFVVPPSSFLLPPSSFLFPCSSFLFPTAGHLVFWKSWLAVDLKKVLSVKCFLFVLGWTSYWNNSVEFFGNFFLFIDMQIWGWTIFSIMFILIISIPLFLQLVIQPLHVCLEVLVCCSTSKKNQFNK